jgi:hypothetical protein
MSYLKRTFRHIMMMKGWRGQTDRPITRTEVQLFLAICWRQGILRSTRFRFWWQLLAVAHYKPRLLYDYLVALGIGEHFFSYRHVIKAQLEEQLTAIKMAQPQESMSLNEEPAPAYVTT